MSTVNEQTTGSGTIERKLWYDSTWLTKYVEAQDIIAKAAPSRLQNFVRSFDTFRVPPGSRHRHLPGFLKEETLEEIRNEIVGIPRGSFDSSELGQFGRFIVRRWPAFTELQARLVPLVSELAGESVEPSYNFLSLYTGMGVCQPHLDAPSSKWTLDICIAQSAPWPISLSRAAPWPETRSDLDKIDVDSIDSDTDLDFSEEVLQPGDAILFSGTNQWHFRRPMARGTGRQFCDLLFLHYIPRGTSALTQPKSWAKRFDIPQLAEMDGLDQTF